MPAARTLDFENSKYEVIDVRSDTVSRPTAAMRQAMFEAEVGDDVYGEDPTVNQLEAQVADLFHKEAAIFIPTGTMGNMMIGGVHTRTVPNLPDGTFDLKLVEKSIRGVDDHVPKTGLIIVENTHNLCGGKVLPMEWMDQLARLTKKHQIPLHMDGARIFNAAVHLKTSVANLTKYCDSVQLCFSKGLGSAAGSMLVGTSEFIKRARRHRTVLGGGMSQMGVLAAPCQVALKSMVDRLAEDHLHTQRIAQGIAAMKSSHVYVDVDGPQTNILMVYLDPEVISSATLCERLVQVTDQEAEQLREDAVIVRVSPIGSSMVRIVLYWEITEEKVRKVVRKIQFIIEELPSASGVA